MNRHRVTKKGISLWIPHSGQGADLIAVIAGWLVMLFKDIATIKKGKWLKLGGMLATRIVLDADNGISQDGAGKKFPPYSRRNAGVGWRRIKTKKGIRNVFIDSYYNLKKDGKAAPKGPGVSRQVSPPNLRLTSTMLNSIKAQRATKESVEINYRDGLKVLGNANPPKKLKKPRRNIYGLNDKNWKFAGDFIADEIDLNIFKFSRKSIIMDVKV